jgi:hypothetical protein
MYIGNLNGPNHGGENGAILMLEDAVRRYRPAAFWFDWAGWDGFSLDALYSMIRSYSPETVIVLNGLPTISNGDWDVIVLEGWGAWGDRRWDLWPFPVAWPKRQSVETWRLVADPDFEYSKDVWPDWQEYLRIQISLIGAGYIANIDHSPTIRHPISTLSDSYTLQCHEKMADWANPPGAPPLHESYTKVDPGPLPEADWGYNTINLSRDVIYLHMLENPYGKTGKPASEVLSLGPIKQAVRRVVWMNSNKPLPFHQRGSDLTIRLNGVTADLVDTIIKIELAGPHPFVETASAPPRQVPPGNLATHKPARLLSSSGTALLPAAGFQFAPYGVDGVAFTYAEAGDEWAWTYQVDLEQVYPLHRVVIHFGPGFATEYKLHLSADGTHWTTVDHVVGCTGGTRQHVFSPVEARYVRVQAIKPDAPDQEGVQMSIAELEVYGAE